jgi:hypothetical protein
VVVRLLVTGSVRRSFDPLDSALGVREFAAKTVGAEAEGLAVTNVDLLQPEIGSGEARLEVGVVRSAVARRLAVALDEVDQVNLPGGRFEVASIDAVELDVEARLQVPNERTQWRLRFLSPTAVGAVPYPLPSAILSDLLTRLAEDSPTIEARFVGRDLDDVLRVSGYDIQSCPVGQGLGWIGWAMVRLGQGVPRSLPVDVVLRAAEVIGVGRDRSLGCGRVRVDDVRNRNVS